uniref:Uncharacterized protein n=1 Tax=Solanum tuberosum TaxID=4113 RepID=M1DBS5_SOLTU
MRSRDHERDKSLPGVVGLFRQVRALGDQFTPWPTGHLMKIPREIPLVSSRDVPMDDVATDELEGETDVEQIEEREEKIYRELPNL